MAIIPCPECGRSVSDRAISCPECGYPISAESAAPVQKTEEDKISKLLVLARRSREGADSKNAKRYYDQILDLDPGNWEPIFYSVYYEAYQCTIRDIAAAANSVANCIHSTFSAIADLNSDSEKNVALKTVMKSCYNIAVMFVASAYNHYSQFSTTTGAYGECSGRVVAAGNIYSEIEQSIKRLFAKKTQILMDHQQEYLSYLRRNRRWYNNTYLGPVCTRLEREISNAKRMEENRKKQEAARKQQELVRKREEERLAQQAQAEAYWQEHTEEKAMLEGEKENLEKENAALEAELHQIDAKNNTEVARLAKEKTNKLPSEVAAEEQYTIVRDLQVRHDSMGLFKGKEKKAISAQLDQIEKPKLRDMKKIAEEQRKEYNLQIARQINEVLANGNDLRKNIRANKERIKEIDDRIAKPC